MSAPKPGDFEIAPYRIRNRGPWVTVEYDLWSDFCLGQTTALGAGAGCGFSDPGLRGLFLSQFDIDFSHQPRQVHKTRLRETEDHSACYPGVDGLVESTLHSALSILTADCLPVFIRSRSTDLFALVHAGWRGIASKIIPKTLEKWFNSEGESLEIIVGAHINQKSYQVGEDVIGEIARCLGYTIDDLIAEGMVNKANKLDLFAVLLRQISQFSCEKIYKLPLDSASETRIPLLSYRRDKTEDRMLHWIYRKNKPGLASNKKERKAGDLNAD